MEVAVNGLPVSSLIWSLDVSGPILDDFPVGNSGIIDLIFAIGVACEQGTATRLLAANIYVRAADKIECSEGLLALTSLLISSKFGEVNPVKIKDLVSFSGGKVTKEEVVRTEAIVMAVLDYTVRTPTLYDWVSLNLLWLSPFLHISIWERLQATSITICELLYESGDLLTRFPPNLLAAGVVQGAVCVLTKCTGICGVTIALGAITQIEKSFVAQAGEEVLVEALGWEFLRQFTVL